MTKIEKFVKEQFGIELTKYQLEIIAVIAAGPDNKLDLKEGDNTTIAFKSAYAYLQDGLTTAKGEDEN